MYFLVETGLHGEPGCFHATGGESLSTGDEVICRTARGLESGRVRSILGTSHGSLEIAGRLLRPMSSSDKLIAERLQRFRLRAIEACEVLLRKHGVAAVLVDAEQLFDGENLIFHFLGSVDESIAHVLDELASLYEQKIQFRQFADRLAEGCGPGCGNTKSGCGDGNSGCGSCGLTGHCRSKS